MNLSSGLKYKHAIKRDIEPVLAKGLVHMFEFKNNLAKHLSNFCNALAGEDTGPYSPCRERPYFPLGFDQKKQIFQALPTTAIGKNGDFTYPIGLYNFMNNVGFLIKPEKVEFVIVEPTFCNNSSLSETQVRFTPLKINGSDHFNKTNIGSEGKISDISSIYSEVPLHRNQDDKIAIRKLFEEDLWNLYSKGFAADSPEFKEHFIAFRNPPEHQFGSSTAAPLLSEILINCPRTSVKGIILYSHDKDGQDISYSAFKKVDEKIQLKGTMMAVLTQLLVKKNRRH